MTDDDFILLDTVCAHSLSPDQVRADVRHLGIKDDDTALSNLFASGYVGNAPTQYQNRGTVKTYLQATADGRAALEAEKERRVNDPE